MKVIKLKRGEKMPIIHKKEEDDIEMVINMTNRNRQQLDDRNQRSINEKNKKATRKKRRIRRLVKVISIVSLVTIALIFAFTSPMFNIKNIEIENNNILSKERIISVSHLTKGQNIFRFLKADIETYLKEEPYIESATITRQLPDTVKINVKERNRDFSVKFMNSYAYINNQGYILEISEDSKGLPIIQGIETPEEEVQVGKRLNKADLKKLDEVIQVMTIAKENEIADLISTIDISDKNEYILYLDKENKTVHLGNSSQLKTYRFREKQIVVTKGVFVS